MTKKQGLNFGYLDTDNYPVSRLWFLNPFHGTHMVGGEPRVPPFNGDYPWYVYDHAYEQAWEAWRNNPNDRPYLSPDRTSYGLDYGWQTLSKIEHYGSDNFYLCYVEDRFSPPLYLVIADSEVDAYEDFVNYAAKHLGIAIELSVYKDYLDKKHYTAYDALTADADRHNFFGQHYDGSISSDGQPVDTESINIRKLTLARIDFATTEQKQD